MRTLSLLALLLFMPGVAAAQEARASDRAAIDACLKTNERINRFDRCVGIVYHPCTERPPSDDDKFPPGSTPGQEECAAREAAVWQEKIDTSLKALRAGPLGQTEAKPYNRPKVTKLDHPVAGSVIIDDMQHAWEISRVKLCDVEAMRYEDGTFARTIYATCLYKAAARHALWLKDLEND